MPILTNCYKCLMIYTDDSICIYRNVCRQDINIGTSYLEKNIIDLYLPEDLGKLKYKFRAIKWLFVPFTSVSMMFRKRTLSTSMYFILLLSF